MMKRTNTTQKIRKLLVVFLVCAGVFSETVYGAGWAKADSGQWRYQREDGTYVYDGFSDDGYYVDGSGIWRESQSILGVEIPNRGSFLPSSQAGSLTSFGQDLKPMMEAVGKDCGNSRSVTLEEQRITYFGFIKQGSSKQASGAQEEQELFSFTKDSGTDGYILRVKCHLTNVKGAKPRTSWYDYQILSAILAKISPAGLKLADAVYSSWEGDNQYGIKSDEWVRVGDMAVKYEGVQGEGIYYIKRQ